MKTIKINAQSSTELIILIATSSVLVTVLAYIVLGILYSQQDPSLFFDQAEDKFSNIKLVEPTNKQPFVIKNNETYGEFQFRAVQKKPAKLIRVVITDLQGQEQLTQESVCEVNEVFPENYTVGSAFSVGSLEVYKVQDLANCPSEKPCCLKQGSYNVKLEAKFYHNDSNETKIEKKAVIIN